MSDKNNDIEEGSKWRRIPPEDSKYFPRNSWVIEVIKVVANSVIHRTVEYDGKPRQGRSETMDKETLKGSYKKEK